MPLDGKTEMTDAIGPYLKRPYTRLVVPEEDGTFRGEILEFPGCFATGDTPAEAYAKLEAVAADWLAAALERGQSIPEPFENTEFSGKLVLRLPKSLHKKTARLASRDGVSLNQFIVTALAEYAGERAKGQSQFMLSISNVTTQIYDVAGNEFWRLSPSLAGSFENPAAVVSSAASVAMPRSTMVVSTVRGLRHA